MQQDGPVVAGHSTAWCHRNNHGTGCQQLHWSHECLWRSRTAEKCWKAFTQKWQNRRRQLFVVEAIWVHSLIDSRHRSWTTAYRRPLVFPYCLLCFLGMGWGGDNTKRVSYSATWYSLAFDATLLDGVILVYYYATWSSLVFVCYATRSSLVFESYATWSSLVLVCYATWSSLDFLQKLKHLSKKGEAAKAAELWKKKWLAWRSSMTLQRSNHTLRIKKIKNEVVFRTTIRTWKRTFAWHSQGKTNKICHLGAAKWNDKQL